MSDDFKSKEVKLAKPNSDALAKRDHVIFQKLKNETVRIEIIKGKTKFSKIPSQYHDTVIIEDLF